MSENMSMDYILNGQGHGDVAARLANSNMDVNMLRPYIGADGRHYVTANDNGVAKAVPLMNATATLRKDDWKLLDQAIVKAAKPRLKAVADLRSRGLTFVIPQGMGKTILETETMSDISAADISMSGIRQSVADRPVFEIGSLPLPIIHKDFHFPLRQVMASRNGGSPLDTTTAELAGAKVAELAEQLLCGTYGTYAFGGGTIYGYINHPNRLTKSMTIPTGSNGSVTVTEILAMRTQAQQAYHYGPYILYCSLPWDGFLDNDFSTVKGEGTLRDRIKRIQNIQDVVTLDYLSEDDFIMVLVQTTSTTVRVVIGMDITTVQWETLGGMMLNFKVMAILVPQLRADQNGNMGIVHGTAS